MDTFALDAQTRTAGFPASIRYFGASREHAFGYGDAFLNITIQLASLCAIAEWLFGGCTLQRCGDAQTPPKRRSQYSLF